MITIAWYLVVCNLSPVLGQPEAPPTPFAPGVAIDFVRRTVHVDARVVLRAGMLELFACEPQTREHESVVVIQARGLHVWQALGLVGLEPGRPPRFDPRSGELQTASGPSLRIRVRYLDNGERRTMDIGRWLWDARRDRPPPPLPWVFSGSRFDDRGRLMCENEGTVICVVDFDTALISVAQSYSARNEDLWLEPNAAVVPPPGTGCVLLISPTLEPTDRRSLGKVGRLWYETSFVARSGLADVLREVARRTREIARRLTAVRAAECGSE